jgi:prevent-host-death family protein
MKQRHEMVDALARVRWAGQLLRRCGHGSYIRVRVAVRALKNGLSAYLRRVRRGERLIVTDRGRPIAEVRPLGHERLTPDERLARLEEAGEVTRPSGRRLGDLRPIRVRGRPVSESLIEDRR